MGGGGEGTLKVPWAPGGTDYPGGPVVKGIGSSVSFFCSFKLNLNQENVSKLLERAWAEGGGRDGVTWEDVREHLSWSQGHGQQLSWVKSVQNNVPEVSPVPGPRLNRAGDRKV